MCWNPTHFLCPFTGSQSVHSAALPEEAPYLLLKNLQYNQTHSNTHSLTQSNTYSVKHTLKDPHSPSETHAETLSSTDTETHSDTFKVTDTLSATHIEIEPDKNSDTHTVILVQLQQVSAVKTANTERYEGTAVEKIFADYWCCKIQFNTHSCVVLIVLPSHNPDCHSFTMCLWFVISAFTCK